MRFGVLGPLAVWTTDGKPIRIPELKVRALLADLLVHAGRPVSVDQLIDDLWGEQLPRNPVNTLQTRVSQLRRALADAGPGGRELVVSQPPGYLLRVDVDALDLHQFRSLAARAREARSPRAATVLLSDALALWRGPALADFGDAEFARAATFRWEEERLVVLEEQAEARLALGEHRLLAGELGDLVTRYPLRERLRAAHLRALYRAGRQSEALAGYRELRERLAEELGVDPSQELVALHEAILRQDEALVGEQVPVTLAVRPDTNLPTSVTDLVGRADAVSELRSALQRSRLVTLTGPGGVGKTQLALETARQLRDTFADGVWLAELAAVGEASQPVEMAEVVAAALRIRDDVMLRRQEGPADRSGYLADAVRTKQLLLVLDNCEHVVDPVAALAEMLLRAAPGLRVLATSQEPLAVSGELVWPVAPLDLPAAGTEPAVVEQSAAVRLFVSRAAAAAPGFVLDHDNADAVARICRQLDGIPLALELAATRVRALGVHELADRLHDRFRVLVSGRRGAPARQRTLRAMIDWSWHLLTGPERVVLRRLAVSADGCTLHAAEEICAEDDLDVLDVLTRLVDRSLVVRVDGADRPRYRLLESVLAYCHERLHEAGELQQIRQRHLRYYTELAERGEQHLYGPDQKRWLKRLDAETANLRAVLDTAVGLQASELALRLVNALAWYWFLRGRLVEARKSLNLALGLGTEPSAERAKAERWPHWVSGHSPPSSIVAVKPTPRSTQENCGFREG